MVVSHPLEPALYIASDAALQELVSQLAQETLLAVDTESNNLYAYTGRVSLIQISTRQQDYIIDPLTIEDMQPLGTLFADATIEKIFHAAEYDLICMRRDFGFQVKNLFDTMYGARLCHIEPFGLADLLYEFFEVEADKSHQRDNWGKRPLPLDSLHYAQMDTHYLLALRDVIRQRLADLERLDESLEVFEDVLRIEAKESDFDPEGYWKIGAPRSFTGRQMACLKELYLLRDKIAREDDVPAFKILTNNALVALVREAPKKNNDLYRIHEVPNGFARLHGQEIMDALTKGRQTQIPHVPQPEIPDPILTERYMSLHAWRKETAMQRNLDASLIVSKNTLWEIARLLPQDKTSLGAITGIGAWRLQAYGNDLLKLIKSLR